MNIETIKKVVFNSKGKTTLEKAFDVFTSLKTSKKIDIIFVHDLVTKTAFYIIVIGRLGELSKVSLWGNSAIVCNLVNKRCFYADFNELLLRKKIFSLIHTNIYNSSDFREKIKSAKGSIRTRLNTAVNIICSYLDGFHKNQIKKEEVLEICEMYLSVMSAWKPTGKEIDAEQNIYISISQLIEQLKPKEKITKQEIKLCLIQ